MKTQIFRYICVEILDIVNPDFPESGRKPSTSDLSPRLSFSWDVLGDGRHVLRGGWGRFVGTTPALLLANAYLANGVTVARITLYGDNPSIPSWPDILSGPGDLPAVTPDVYLFEPGFRQPEVERTAVEYEQDLGWGWSASLGAHYAEYSHLERKQDVNLQILGDNEYSKYDRPNDNFNRMICFKSDAWGRYKAVTLQARYRNDSLFWHAHYTYSESEDNDSNERSTSTRDFYPEDQYDLSKSWGKSDFDAPHRIVTYAAWNFYPGWTLSGQAIFQSGFPYTALSGSDDNGDGYYSDHATYNGKHYGRNTFRQPDYKTVDLRLSYAFSLGPGSLGFMLDVFNLFDSSNLTTDNLTYTATEDGTVVRRDDFGELNIAGPPRQYQIGVKYSF